MRFLYRRGRGAKRRVVHLCSHDWWTGGPTMTALCGSPQAFNTTCNLPLGRPVCRRCAKAGGAQAMTQPPTRPGGGERIWSALHTLVNRAAWRWARPAGEEWGIGLRIDHSRLLWRLNDWLADRYVPTWVKRHSPHLSTPQPKEGVDA